MQEIRKGRGTIRTRMCYIHKKLSNKNEPLKSKMIVSMINLGSQPKHLSVAIGFYHFKVCELLSEMVYMMSLLVVHWCVSRCGQIFCALLMVLLSQITFK